MTHDFHARYALPTRDQMTQAYAVDYLTGYAETLPEKLPELAEIEDPAARLEVLAQAAATGYKDRARIGQLRGKPGGLWHWIASGKAKTFFEERKAAFLQPLGLLPTLPDMTVLPFGSWGMRLSFTLASPYISRDDTVWHILDNPLKKEWVFKLPYVSPSQWKGALRAAIRQHQNWKNEQPDLLRLFGDAAEDKGRAGRLHFYPTFFTEIGLEVINPHSREKGAGKQPIYFECVPAGATGDFVLLYVPFDRIGGHDSENRRQADDDLRLVSEGVKAMLTGYGFGAKTSSGFGTAILNDWKTIGAIS